MASPENPRDGESADSNINSSNDSNNDAAAVDDASAVLAASAKPQEQEQQNNDQPEPLKLITFPAGVANGHNDVAPAVEIAGRSHNRGKLTDEETELALMALVEEGKTVRQSAEIVNIPLRTAYSILARNESDIEALRATTRKLMAAQALDRIEDWKVASQVGAAKKGNHAPARDWLLHAGVLDSLESDHVGVRIAINIGTDDRPMRIRSPNRQSEED